MIPSRFIRQKTLRAPARSDFYIHRLPSQRRPNGSARTQGSPSRGAGSAQPRLRGCIKFAIACCLRRPYLFSCKRKDRGEKSAWTRLVPPASEFRQVPIFQASFHTILTSRASWYAPPDTGVSGLQLVALERLLSIEGAAEILMSVAFLRGSL